MQLSVVIPIHNDVPSILPLYDRLTVVLEKLRTPYEIIFVDDASTDRSFDLLANLVETDGHMKVVRLRRRFGQSAALAAGFDEAQGSVIVTLDGDLQDAPEDIPALLEKIQEGYDIASGWRKNLVDGAATRKIPSRIANWLMAKACDVELRDFSTTFKAYRAEIVKEVNLYGELHRFIPGLASLYGARIAEVPVKSIPRPAGGSRHGANRSFHVMLDIFGVWFLLKYLTRPMHFFGKWGLACASLGGGILIFLAGKSQWTGGNIIEQNGALMVAGALALISGVILFCTGLLGEVLTRTYYESQGRRIYAVREVRSKREAQAPDGAQGAHGSHG